MYISGLISQEKYLMKREVFNNQASPQHATRSTATATASSIRQQLDAMLGEYARPQAKVLPDQDKADWYEHIGSKYNR